MPCVVIDIGEAGGSAIICGVPKRLARNCFYCGRSSEFLCDFPVVKKAWLGIKKSCDRALCKNCRLSGISPDVDFCREHYGPAKAAYERRMKNAQ